MQALPLFFDLRDRPVVLVGDGEGAAPKRRLLTAAGALVVDTPTDRTRLAIVAIDDDQEAATIADQLRGSGHLVNVVDKPSLCDFSFPAIVDRAPVTIAIATGGASATLSKALRERFEAMIPATLGEVAASIRRRRPAVNAAIARPARRLFWDRLMAPGAPLDPFTDCKHPDDAIQSAVQSALTTAPTPPAARHDIYPSSGDPDDLTLRDLRALSQADLILVERGAPPRIVDRGRRDAERAVYEDDESVPASGRSVVVRRI
ncbi:MAG: NAD(P)-dependent oxidoreductase [Pseudomonadota bacterium]